MSEIRVMKDQQELQTVAGELERSSTKVSELSDPPKLSDLSALSDPCPLSTKLPLKWRTAFLSFLRASSKTRTLMQSPACGHDAFR